MNADEDNHTVDVHLVNDDDFHTGEIDKNSVLRIEKDLNVGWSGVKNCCRQDRVQREVDGAYLRWRNDLIAEHVNQRYLGSGHGGGQARCSSSGGGPFGQARSCRGSATIKAWIEFQKP